MIGAVLCLGAAFGLAWPLPAVAKVIRIKVDDLAFDPVDVVARPGDTVEWFNADFVDHTATERQGVWDVALPAGGSGRIIAGPAGIFHYYCRFHPQMQGTVRVKTR